MNILKPALLLAFPALALAGYVTVNAQTPGGDKGAVLRAAF